MGLDGMAGGTAGVAAASVNWDDDDNAITAVERGAAALDASAGGIGGCPFAPAATGNIATEDLLYLLDRSAVRTGVSATALAPATDLLASTIGKPVPGLFAKAGPFPPSVEASSGGGV